MTLEWTSYRSPAYVSANGQSIDCILTVTGMGDIPFTATATDPEQYGRDLFAAIVTGASTIPIAAYVAPPAPPPPTIQQQAVALLSNPTVTVACAAIPALDGVYLVDAASRGDITGIAVAINGGLGLPSGGATFNYTDAAGVSHAWPAPQFIAFAQGVLNYIYHLAQVAGGTGTALPASILTVA